MILILSIIAILYIAIKTVFLETKHDACIIDDICENDKKECWKLFGGLMVASELVILTSVIWYITGSVVSLLLLPVLTLVYSICHDCGVSYRLTGGLFHLGKGGWDSKIAQIFQNGTLWFIWKMVWLIIASGTYFHLIKEI